MPDSEVVLSYDVVIAGAGPAGCACALALRNAGLRVAILDKQSFPRDKVCGDAIPGRAIKTLRDIDPIFSAAFSSFAAKLETKRTALNYKGRKLTFNWVGEAFTCARMQFDHFLFSLVTAHTTTSVYTNIRPQKYEQDENGITIHAGGGQMFKAKILIGADGAQSVVAKQLASQTLDRNHHVGSVRAYYHNVAGTISQVTEIFFNKKYLPSYLWVFPLPGNRTNVGFGMLSSEIARRKVNIKKTFYEFIEQTPELKSRFKDAVQTGDLEGFGLPLGSGITTLSGNNFMLTGDAASLIDPISGDGIGNAMLSGKLAAAQAIKCFEHNNFTASFIKGYDTTLLSTLGMELKARHRAQKVLSAWPSLLDVVFLASKNKIVKKLLQKGL